MLQQITLDDERFTEIMEKMKARIPEIYPTWTDYNYHDPGITILELFAWLKEMQQFHMDRIGERHIRAYLRLLGAAPRGKCPAKAVVRVEKGTGSFFFPKGSQCFAGEICFETKQDARIPAAEAVRLIFCPAAKEEGKEAGRTAEIGRGMRFFPFGKHPAAKDALRFGLSAPLKPRTAYRMGIHLASAEAGVRNPVEDAARFCPLARFSLFSEKEGTYRKANITKDTTYQFLQDGFLAIEIEEEMTAGEDGLCWLKLVLEESGYEVPPILADVSLRELDVRQQRTLAECHDGQICPGEPVRVSSRLAFVGNFLFFRKEGEEYCPCEGNVKKQKKEEEVWFTPEEYPADGDMNYRLICYEAEKNIVIGEGTGLPFQEYEMPDAGICAGGLMLLIETEAGSGRYVCPRLCADFSESGPLDLDFCYEEETGRIFFGDCEHGMAPEGKILLAAACESIGRHGNVREGSIRGIERCIDGKKTQVSASNENPAAGGSDTETGTECRARLLENLRTVGRAVTYKDFETLALATPGLMVESVRAIPVTKYEGPGKSVPEESVMLAVKPCSLEERPIFGEAYRKNILRAIEPARIIGTRVVVVPPEYIGVSVFAEIAAGRGEQEAKTGMKAAVSDYFAKIRGVFGVTVSAGDIYAALDVSAGITEIQSLTLDAQGRNIRRSRSGDLILPANGLAYLKECILGI